MGAKIDGARPTTIHSAKRALVIAEHEARRAGLRGDVSSENNMRALVNYLAEVSFAELRPEPIARQG